MTGYVYVGESARGRILRYGIGFSQVGDPYQLEVASWEQRAAGPIGVAVYRTVVAVLRHVAGYNVQLTPVLDGRPLSPQQFSGGPPSQTKLRELVQCVALVFTPGTDLGVIFKTVAIPGEIELIDLFATAPPIRGSQ